MYMPCHKIYSTSGPDMIMIYNRYCKYDIEVLEGFICLNIPNNGY